MISAGYGAARVLHYLSLDVRRGEIVALVGRNGAGKTTTLKAIMGLVRLHAGEIRLAGKVISTLPAHRIAAEGIGYVPQGRRLFSELTVRENLIIGLMAGGQRKRTLERAIAPFPRLAERMNQPAGTLSGGEQQMLAMARALCVAPRLLLLDEPTEGLQPSMITLIRDVIARLRSEGVAILLVEQRIDAVLALADRVTFLENGRLGETAEIARLRSDPGLLQHYLGV